MVRVRSCKVWYVCGVARYGTCEELQDMVRCKERYGTCEEFHRPLDFICAPDLETNQMSFSSFTLGDVFWLQTPGTQGWDPIATHISEPDCTTSYFGTKGSDATFEIVRTVVLFGTLNHKVPRIGRMQQRDTRSV